MGGEETSDVIRVPPMTRFLRLANELRPCGFVADFRKDPGNMSQQAHSSHTTEGVA